MRKVTWRRFDQSAKQLVVGRTTIKSYSYRNTLAYLVSVREYVFFVFFQISKNMTFYVFLKWHQKVVKSHQQKFSPQCVTKEWSLRSMITVVQFLAPISHFTYDFIHNRKRNRLTEARARDLVYVHSNLKLLQKLQSLDYQEANVERER